MENVGDLVVPDEPPYRQRAVCWSFQKLLGVLDANEAGIEELNIDIKLCGPSFVGEQEAEAAQRIPGAFFLNSTFKTMSFFKQKVNDNVMAQIIRAGISKNEIDHLDFDRVQVKAELRETVCMGLSEKTNPFKLSLFGTSVDLNILILKASFLNCFSLKLSALFCNDIKFQRVLKRFISKNFLFYIELDMVTGSDKFFLEFSRCISMSTGLSKLKLRAKTIPKCVLQRLFMSLKYILENHRTNLLKEVKLKMRVTSLEDENLAYCYFSFLKSDLISNLDVNVGSKSITNALRKYISSNVENTRVLNSITFVDEFHSQTEFNKFSLQEVRNEYRGPFAVGF